MSRAWLRDDQFERIAALLPGKASDPGRTAADNRLFVEAVLWIARTGSPWRDLPRQFGRGTVSINALRGGRGAVSGIASSLSWRRMRISKKCSSTAPLFAPISTRRGHPKKRGPSARAISWRTERL